MFFLKSNLWLLLIFFVTGLQADELLQFGEFKQDFSVSSQIYSNKFNQSGGEERIFSKVKVKAAEVKKKLGPELQGKIVEGTSPDFLATYLYDLRETKYQTDFYYGILPNLTIGINLSLINQSINPYQINDNNLPAGLTGEEKSLFRKVYKESLKNKLKGQSKNLPEYKEEYILGDIKLKGILDPGWSSKKLNLLGELTLPSGSATDQHELLQLESSGKFALGLGFKVFPYSTESTKASLKIFSRLNFDQVVNMSVYDDNYNYLGEDGDAVLNHGMENQIDLDLRQKFFNTYNFLMGLTYFKRSQGKLEGTKFESAAYEKYFSDLHTAFQSYKLELHKSLELFGKTSSLYLKYANIFNGTNVYKTQSTQLGFSYVY